MAHRWSATGANPVSALSLSVTSDAAADPTDEAVLVVVSGVVATPGTVDCASVGATVEEVIPLTTDNNVWGAAWLLTNVSPSTLITVTVDVGKNMTVAASAYEGSGLGASSAVFLRADGSNLSTLPPYTADEVTSTIVDLWVHRDTATNGTPPGSTMIFVDEGTVTAQLDGSATGTGATGHAAVSDRGVLGVTAIGDVAGTYFDDAGVVARGSTNALGRSVEVLAGTIPPPTTGQSVASMVSWLTDDAVYAGWITVPGAAIRMAVGELGDLSDAVFSAAEVADAFGWVPLTVAGLDPDTHYFVGYEVNGTLQTDSIMEATTLPTPGTPTTFTVLAGSCQITGSNHAVFARMALESASYGLHFGDLMYADATTEVDWRDAVADSLAPSNVRAWCSGMPVMWLYDNHDWGGDLSWSGSPAGGFVPAAYRRLTGDLLDATGGWRTWVHGRVRFIRTDMYSQRSDPADVDGPAKVLLGATQKQWWKDTLEAATEPVIVWASGWPNHDILGGRWKTYTTDVQDMEDWLDARPAIKARVISIGGDSHDIRADSGSRPPVWQAFSGLPSLNVSPFNQTGETGETQDWDIGRLAVPDDEGVYARLTFTDSGGDDIVLLWEAVDQDGDVLLSWTHGVLASAEFAGSHEWTDDGWSAVGEHTAEFAGTHEWNGEFLVAGSSAFNGTHEWTGTGDGAGFTAEAAPLATFAGAHEWEGGFFSESALTAEFAGTHHWVGTWLAQSAAVLVGVCGWEISAPDCCERWDGATTAQRERAVMLATDFLWAASGRRFGACEFTVRPCGLSCPCEATGGCVGGSNAYNTARFGFTPVLDGGVWSNCKSCTECRCCAPCEVMLPGHVDSIVSVRVDGVTVPPTAYRVDNYKYLVRDDGQCWPECNDYGKRDGEGTFEVTYLEGVPVPYAGLAAASELACYLLKTCPDGVNCGSCLEDGAEQSPIVATWLANVNPHKLSRPARVFVPGAASSVHRVNTWRAE
jgi:hypothetical protein